MPGILATVAMLFAKIGKNSISNLITTQQENKLNNQLNKLQLEHGRKMIEMLKRYVIKRRKYYQKKKTLFTYQHQ